MIPYLHAASGVLAAGLVTGALLARPAGRIPRPDERTGWLLAGSAAALCALVYGYFSLWRLHNLHAGIFDLGIFDSMAHNLAFKGEYLQWFNGRAHDHFTPAFILLSPFYRIADSPKTLLVLQAAAAAGAALPLYALAKTRLGDRRLALFAAGLYLLNPYLGRGLLYDFHMGAFLPLVLFSAFLSAERGRRGGFAALALLACLLKEEYFLAVFASGLYFVSQRERRREGVIALAIPVAAAAFAFAIYFPHLVEFDYEHMGRFPPLFGVPPATMAESLWTMLRYATHPYALRTLLSLLMPMAFLPVLSRRAFLLLCLPALLANVVSLHDHQRLFMSHYAFGAATLLPLAALDGMANLRGWLTKKRRWRHLAFSCAAGVALCTHIAFSSLPWQDFHQYIGGVDPEEHFSFLSIPLRPGRLAETDHVKQAHELFRIIPPEARVAAQNNLGVFFVRHRGIHMLPGPDGMDVYLFDPETFIGFTAETAWKARIKGLRNDPQYIRIRTEEGTLAFVRRDFLPRLQR